MRLSHLGKWIVMMIITYLFQGEREHIGFYSPTIQRILQMFRRTKVTVGEFTDILITYLIIFDILFYLS